MKLYKADMAERVYVEATPEDVVAAFRELPQTTQMRAAADVLVDAEGRYDPENPKPDRGRWHAVDLRTNADQWDRQDAEKAKQANEMEELARTIYSLDGIRHPFDAACDEAKEFYREKAKRLIAAGYRKQATDE